MDLGPGSDPIEISNRICEIRGRAGPSERAEVKEKSNQLRASGRDEDPDGHLIQEVLAGDPSAYEELVRRHEATLSRVIFGILGDAHLAEDVLQDVMLIGYRKLTSFRGESRFSTWLTRIAVREAWGARSRWKRFRQRFAPLDESRTGAATGSLGSRPVEGTAARVLGMIGRLPRKERTALILHVVEQQSYSQISEVLRCPGGTVGSLISRARVRLQKMMPERETIDVLSPEEGEDLVRSAAGLLRDE